MILSSVDFPAPFSPTRPTTCPSSRRRLTSDNAFFPAKALLIPLSSREEARPFAFALGGGSIGANDDRALVAREIADALNGIGRKALRVKFGDAVELALVAGLRVSLRELIIGGLRRAPCPVLFGRQRDQKVLRVPVLRWKNLDHLKESLSGV